MARLTVDVVYATPVRQQVVPVELEAGATAVDAFRASGLALGDPAVDKASPLLGVFGTRVAPDTRLKQGDRVEVYRALVLDPKEARRAKVATARRRSRR